MAKILLGYRQDRDAKGERIITYSNSTHQALLALGHTVLPMGQGHKHQSFAEVHNVKQYALFLDLDCGRNRQGNFNFSCQDERAPIPSAVRWIDSHGHPSYHKRASVNYDHVFFAVWSRRDLFVKHPSVHWCPNASDARYFGIDAAIHGNKEDNITVCHKQFDVGFFGSKGGLKRADALKEIAIGHSWKYDIREIGRANRNRWPMTAQAMDLCKVLFNKGQKHDGPNQRVIESMLMNVPLVTDTDKSDGMDKLFEYGEHYLGYTNDAELANNIEWCLHEPSLAHSMALRAYKLAYDKHQVKHRVEQILEVCNVK
jgi:hypothetical protein